MAKIMLEGIVNGTPVKHATNNIFSMPFKVEKVELEGELARDNGKGFSEAEFKEILKKISVIYWGEVLPVFKNNKIRVYGNDYDLNEAESRPRKIQVLDKQIVIAEYRS